MVRRLLIANRGEIAVRIIRACRELGIEVVVASAQNDLKSMPAELADDVAAVASYLDAQELVGAAVAAGADAVHPGYGFLSEDARFAEAVVAAGLVWVGPPSTAMRLLGDKISARSLAERVGVPVVPGATGDDAALLAAAPELGVPLFVKATGGGGGRGMRAVAELDDLPSAIAAAREEAEAAFGDGRVFLERRLTGVRHVEVQILIDEHDTAVHLGERDCSLQRRHQKVLEESPSPAVDEDLRTRLGDSAVAISQAAGYRGAGTVEFLLLPDRTFVFLEMNARLQVEHPVTEAVTGVDLVRAQLTIADSQQLGFRQNEVVMRGHAIEARVYAEDPANGFLPTGGRAEKLMLPRWPGVRIDTALREGDEVSIGYDPLLAKVIAAAEDRTACLARLREALAGTAVVGIATNLGFLLDALADPAVLDGRAGTDWVSDTWRPDPPSLPDGVVATRSGDADPWTAFAAQPLQPEGVVSAGAWAQYRGWAYHLAHGDESDPIVLAPPGGSLTAPMPASVLRIQVADGDQVAAGEIVVVLEAMKMQMAVRAPTAGTVRAVSVRQGELVVAGQVLLELDET